MASEIETAITVLDAEVKLRDRRAGAWESDGQRSWYVSAIAHLGGIRRRSRRTRRRVG